MVNMNPAMLISSDDIEALEEHVPAPSKQPVRLSVPTTERLPRERLEETPPEETQSNEPDWPTIKALTRRGIQRARAGDLDGAIADYSSVLEVHDHLPALANRGVARFHVGDYEQACHDCSRALELAPKLAKAWMVRGLARVKVGQTEEAHADLMQFMTLAPRTRYTDLVMKTLDDLEA
jgi:tetratricopeptide (TPR) repeat protein